MKRYLTVALRDLKIYLGIEFHFVAYLIHLSFHVFHVLRNSCIISHKNHSSSKNEIWRLFGKNLFRDGKKTLNIEIAFSMRGDAAVWRDFVSTVAFKIFFDIKNFWREASLNFCRKNCKAKRCANFSNFPAKSLSF